MSNIKNILKFAMRMEKDAQDFYSFYMDKVKSEATKELFRELSEIEQQHYTILKSKFDELGFQEPPVTISWVVDSNFSSKDPHILADTSDIIGDSEDGISDLTVIRMAYLIESDFAAFYKNAIDVVDDIEAKEFLSTLAGWEVKHKELFFDRYQLLLKKHWGDMSSIIFAK